MASQDKLMRYIQYLPPDMKYVIKTFIPISILKKVRKLKKNELPINYKIAKELNEHFYMTSVGYNLDINTRNNYIKYLKKKIIHLNSMYYNTYNIHECYQITTNKQVTNNLIENKKIELLMATLMYSIHNEYYTTSSDQLQCYNIIET